MPSAKTVLENVGSVVLVCLFIGVPATLIGLAAYFAEERSKDFQREQFMREAATHGAAHYDAKSGEFRWNDEPNGATNAANP